MITKSYYSTAEGQRDLCNAADSRATAFMMAKFLRGRGVPTYDDSFIHTATGATLAAIKTELLADYNAELSQSKA